MAFTYDLTTNIGKIRLLIADTDEDSYDFEDDEIATAYTMSLNAYYASAVLLRSLAANRARLSVSVKRGTLTDDLKQLSKDLKDLADAMEEKGKAEIEDVGGLEAIIEPVYDDFSYRRYINKNELI